MTSGVVRSVAEPEDDAAAAVFAEAEGELRPGADGVLVAPPFATALAAAASAALRPADVPLLEDNPEPDDTGSLDPDPLEPAEAEPEPFRTAGEPPGTDVVDDVDDDAPKEDPADDAPPELDLFTAVEPLPDDFTLLAAPEPVPFVVVSPLAPDEPLPDEPLPDEPLPDDALPVDAGSFTEPALGELVTDSDGAASLPEPAPVLAASLDAASFTMGPESVTVGAAELPGRDEEPLPAVPSDGLTCHLRRSCSARIAPPGTDSPYTPVQRAGRFPEAGNHLRQLQA